MANPIVVVRPLGGENRLGLAICTTGQMAGGRVVCVFFNGRMCKLFI